MWNLHENGTYLKPLVFSNGKTQEVVVKEILNEIKKGAKIIFIQGVCGTGKSAIALNVAKELGKTSIVVPGKTLQEQYQKDYEKNKYVLGKNNKKLKIRVITGRNNHLCTFLQDKKTVIPKFTKEINSKLHDIFEGKGGKLEKEISKDDSAENKNLPCKIDIKEKNWNKIKRYLVQNKFIDRKKLKSIQDVKRVSVASVCPYWSPVFDARFEMKGPVFKKAKKQKYMGLGGKEFIFYERKKGCPFYEQFNYFIDADVIVFNSLKYKLETVMDRKPLTEVEIIDECDEFLDSFSEQKKINLDRLQNSLIKFVKFKEEFDDEIKEIFEIIKHTRKNWKSNFGREITEIKKTGIYDVFRIILKNPEIFKEADDESYLFHVEEVAKTFKGLMDETFVSIREDEKNLIFNFITVNLAKRFKNILDKNKVIVLMSGTLHSDEILKNVFGLEGYKKVEAETKNQGIIKIKKTGFEADCKYSNFVNGKLTREDYLKALDKCVELAEKPTLVHINAFMDLPTEIEIKENKLVNLKSREKIKTAQMNDKKNNEVAKFKKGEINVLFSTKVARGMDFPGDECRSIIFTRYPNPDIKNPFWKALMKTRPENYWEFYKDKARREILQKVYRGLRFEKDEVEVWSPDLRVIEFFEKLKN